MCNCSTNSCDCNDYRVSTGPQGNTGPQGPQGPAGPPGNSTYLYSIAYSSGLPATTIASGYETLGSYTLTAGEVSFNNDVLIVKARLIVFSGDQTTKNIRFRFGGNNYPPKIINTVIPSILNFGTLEMELVIERTSVNTQTINIKALEGWNGNNKNISATTGIVNFSNSITIDIQAEAGNTTLSNVSLSSFNIQKITA